MSSPYIRSAVWLLGCSALGYGLLVATAPSDTKLAAIRHSSGTAHSRAADADMRRRQQLLMEKLAASAEAKPVYLQTPAEVAAQQRAKNAAGK